MISDKMRERFFDNRDETGRYKIVSFKTGVEYFIEPIGSGRPADWGSYNPSTGNIENKKGHGKYTGSVKIEESIITEENGFENVVLLGIGESPEGEITRRDEEHYKNGRRPKVNV